MNVLVIGKSGQLAQELADSIPNGYTVTFAGRADIDLFDKKRLVDNFEQNQYNCVINASAYTAVDKAEQESEAAFALNEKAVRDLAMASKQIGARFIHVSTDFVFKGDVNTPLSTQHPVDPQSVYGKSKLAGEIAISTLYPENSVIIRTSWLYSTYGNNFVKTMLRVMQQRPELSVVNDQFGSPTYAKGLAEFIWQLTKLPSVESIYHWSDKGHVSWFGFAEEIARQAIEMNLLHERPKILTTTTEAYGAPAPRPAYSVMDCSSAYSIKPGTDWKEHLHEMLERLRA